MEDGETLAEEPVVAAGELARVKIPTKRFTDAEWYSH